MKLNCGCGTHYAEGWVNTDVWSDATTRPDVVVAPGEPYPFDDSTFDAVYLGHVLEHIPWPALPEFLREIRRICARGALVLAVGPDVYRTIELWKEGRQPWFMVESVLEHQPTVWQSERDDKVWEGASHHWNCHEDRLVALLESQGFGDVEDCSEEIPNRPGGRGWVDRGIEWPVVGKHEWQCAVRAII